MYLGPISWNRNIYFQWICYNKYINFALNDYVLTLMMIDNKKGKKHLYIFLTRSQTFYLLALR